MDFPAKKKLRPLLVRWLASPFEVRKRRSTLPVFLK